MPADRLFQRWIPTTAVTLFLAPWVPHLLSLLIFKIPHLEPGPLRTELVFLTRDAGWLLAGSAIAAAQGWAARMPAPLRREWMAVTAFVPVAGVLAPRVLSIEGEVPLESLAWGVAMGLGQAALFVRPERAVTWAVATIAGFAVGYLVARHIAEERSLLEEIRGAWSKKEIYAPLVASVLCVSAFTGAALLFVRGDLEVRARSRFRRAVVVVCGLAAFAAVLADELQRVNEWS